MSKVGNLDVPTFSVSEVHSISQKKVKNLEEEIQA